MVLQDAKCLIKVGPVAAARAGIKGLGSRLLFFIEDWRWWGVAQREELQEFLKGAG